MTSTPAGITTGGATHPQQQRYYQGVPVVDVSSGSSAAWGSWVSASQSWAPRIQTWYSVAVVAVVLCWPLGLVALEYSKAASRAEQGSSEAFVLARRSLAVSCLAGVGALAWVLISALVLGALVGHFGNAEVVPLVVEEGTTGVYV